MVEYDAKFIKLLKYGLHLMSVGNTKPIMFERAMRSSLLIHDF